MTERNRGYYRERRHKAIAHNAGIIKNKSCPLTDDMGVPTDPVKGFTNGKPGKLSKGKVFCSCPICKPRGIKTFRQLKEQSIAVDMEVWYDDL